MRIEPGPVVYVLLGNKDRVLYVGATQDFERRFREHARTKSWWREVHDAKWIAASNWSAALAIESRLIAALAPSHNTQHVPAYYRNQGSDGLPKFPEVNEDGEHRQLELLSIDEFTFVHRRYIDRADANTSQAEKIRERCLDTHGVDLGETATAS